MKVSVLFAQVLDWTIQGVWIELAGDEQNADSAIGAGQLWFPGARS